MRHMLRITATLFLLLATLSASAGPQVKPGTGLYLVVLRSDASKAQEPDLAALGGTLIETGAGRRLVMLPPGRAEELRRHQAVAYVQRIWTGEEIDDEPLRPSVQRAEPSVASTPPVEDWNSGEYLYDPSGNIRAIGPDAYTYDPVGRVTGALQRGESQTYRYDAFGNLRQLGPRSLSVVPGNNRLSGVTYDAVGNATVDPTVTGYTRTFYYDAAGMVAAIDNFADDRRMIYTADDERIVVTGGSSSSYRIRGFDARVLREWRSTVGGVLEWDRDYVYADGRLVAGSVQVSEPQSHDRHYHLDHLGSIRMVTDGAGRALMRHDYWPFGAEQLPNTQEYAATGHPRDPAKYTGHERDYFSDNTTDGEDHLDYMHARYYRGEVGRFLSVDPTWESADLGKPQSWNRYAYVMNNPVNMVDPDGKWGIVFDLLDGGTPLFEKDYDKNVSDNPPRSQAEFDQRVAAGTAVRTFQTYTKTHPEKPTYTGKTSGTGTPEQNVARRDGRHHKNAEGYNPAQLDKSSTNEDAIRGREQQGIDANGGARSRGGTSGNAIDGISQKNPKRATYLKQALREFGEFIVKIF